MKMRLGVVVLFAAMVAWMGAASAAETTVTMDANKTVTAVFVKQWTLTMAATPSADGTTSPAVGTHAYDDGATVNLTATGNPGYAFDHWEGNVADPNAASTTITISADETVTAVFTPGNALTVESSPSPGVSITGTHPGTTTYLAQVPEGTSVTLTAPTFAGGRSFDQWSDLAGEMLSPSQTLALSFLSNPPSPTALYAGTAIVDITPPEEDAVDLTNNEMQIHDNIHARVLVLKTDDVSIAIVSLDLILFSSAKVVADAKAQWGVDHVILSSTHTHSSMAPQGLIIGGGQPDWTRMGDPEELIDWPALSSDPWYAETEGKIVAAIGEAMGDLFPARIGSAATPFEGYYTTHNRRHINPDGSVSMWWSNPSRTPSPPVDHQIRVIRVDDATGNPRAVMVHYSCHPVCLMGAGWLSPDFPGTMCDYVETELGEDCMGMFLQGAEGDIDPYEISLRDEYGFDYVEDAGNELGQAAVSLAETIVTPASTTAAIRIEENMVPIAHRSGGGSTEACVMSVVVNEDFAMMTVPGEPFIQHQLNLAERSLIANTMMLGLAYCGRGNPFLIYVPTAQAVAEGGYGADECSFVEPDAGDNMVNAALAFINAFVSDTTIVAEYTDTIVPDLYVNDDVIGEEGSLCTAIGNDANTGLSPDVPMRSIQALLDTYPNSGTGETVWVDPGTYVENITVASTHSGLTLKGAGAETTIIDGNAAGVCLRLNGFYDSVITGFTLRNGDAASGAGMYINTCNPLVMNCNFTNNAATELGGGIYCYTNSAPTVKNCTFSGNSARWGAGMLNYYCEATVTDCTFTGNIADGATGGGGGMVNHYSSITVTNCVFSDNTAGSGGGICNEGTPTIMTNCTFTGNSADDDGGGICNDDASPTVTNCILWDNTATRGPQIGYFATGPTGPNTLTVRYSDVQGGEAGVGLNTGDTLDWGPGNMDADPLFVSATDVHLQTGSPCIDAANGTAAPEFDLDSHPRCDDFTMPNVGNGPPWADMGAYELQAALPVTKGDFDMDGDMDFWDFMEFIDCYGMTGADPGWSPNGPIGDFDDNGNVDFWDFMEFIDVYGTTQPTYSLTVNNGDGDGDYIQFAVVDISADPPPTEQVFNVWTGDTAYVADIHAATTTVTMPDQSVTVTATYAANSTPAVDAGPDDTITLPANATLDGTVTDDGLPNPPGAFTATWTMQSGPGTVTFSNAAAVDTTASFSTDGTYVLRLTADDSDLMAYDEVTLTVNPSTSPASVTFTVSSCGTGDGPWAIGAANLDSDSDIDIVVANLGGASASALLNNGDGTFAAHSEYGAGSSPRSVAFGDFDGDDYMDMALANNSDDDVSVLLNDGDGTFGTKTDYSTGTGPYSVAVKDFNRNGNLDMAVARTSGNHVEILPGNGNGTFGTGVEYPVGNVSLSTAAGYFDADSYADLVVGSSYSSAVFVLLNNGDGTLGAYSSYPVDDSSYAVAVGDFNGDGYDDIVAVNHNTDMASVLLNDGGGAFGANTDYAVGDSPQAVTAADLNWDGHLDIAVANYSDHTVSVLLGIGDGTFGTKTDYTVGTGPHGITAADFNGDSKIDLATADSVSDTVSVLLNTGGE